MKQKKYILRIEIKRYLTYYKIVNILSSLLIQMQHETELFIIRSDRNSQTRGRTTA